jgi:hypothetical protein
MTAPMGLRYIPDGTAIQPPKGVGVVGREVGRVELNYNCNPAASRRKPTATATATATDGGTMQLQLKFATATAIQAQVDG